MKHKHLTVKVTKEAHPHIEMIVAKAANMDLALFFKAEGGNWRISTLAYMAINDKHDYFLCLPQHKDACLHWLNGGDAEQKPKDEDCWVACSDVSQVTWMPWTSFMKDDLEFSIKPRKEKRWIAFKWDNFYVLPRHFESKEDAEMSAASSMMGEFQYKEIEVEV